MFNKSLFDKGNENLPKNSWVNKTINGFNMSLDIEREGIARALYHQGGRELAFMGLIDETIKRGMTCIDLGSNIGYTTLPMLRNVGEDGKVYAIEPDPNNLEVLKANISQNGFNDRCEIVNCAISDKSGDIDFWMSNKTNLSSVQKTNHSTSKITVPAFSLGDFCKDRNYPNFIKMDVEGHEVKIFEGALEFFTKNDGETSILLEVHPHFYDDENDFEKILKEFFKIGFKSKYVIATPVPQPRLFLEAGYTPLKTVKTDGFHRGIYENISEDDLLRFSCRENIEGTSKKIVRSFMITRS